MCYEKRLEELHILGDVFSCHDGAGSFVCPCHGDVAMSWKNSSFGRMFWWHKRKVVRTKIVTNTSHEQIGRNVAAGANYVPPKKSGSGLHEFSYEVKKKK